MCQYQVARIEISVVLQNGANKIHISLSSPRNSDSSKHYQEHLMVYNQGNRKY